MIVKSCLNRFFLAVALGFLLSTNGYGQEDGLWSAVVLQHKTSSNWAALVIEQSLIVRNSDSVAQELKTRKTLIEWKNGHPLYKTEAIPPTSAHVDKQKTFDPSPMLDEIDKNFFVPDAKVRRLHEINIKGMAATALEVEVSDNKMRLFVNPKSGDIYRTELTVALPFGSEAKISKDYEADRLGRYFPKETHIEARIKIPFKKSNLSVFEVYGDWREQPLR